MSPLVASLLAAVSLSPGNDEGKRFLGQRPPEIEARDWINCPKPLSLKTLEGRVALIQFFATYNQPSLRAIPFLTSLHKRYGTLGLVVLGVTEEGKPVADAFAKEQGVPFPIAASSKAAALYGVTGLPYAYLIAADGAVAWQGSPLREPEDLEKLVEKSLRRVQFFAVDRDVDPKVGPVVAIAERGEFGRALKEARKLSADADPKVVADAKYVSEKLLAVAKRGTEFADALVKEGKFFDASEILDRVAKKFSGHEEGAAAEKILKEWAADPKISQAIEADRLLDKAEGLYNQRKLTRAKIQYELFLKKFPLHPAATDAEARLEEVNGWIASCFCGSGKPFARCHGRQ